MPRHLPVANDLTPTRSILCVGSALRRVAGVALAVLADEARHAVASAVVGGAIWWLSHR